MAPKREPNGKTELPFHKQLILGLAIAFAGTAGTVVSIGTGQDPTCPQAMEIVRDDSLNADLPAQRRQQVTLAAADKALRCLRKD